MRSHGSWHAIDSFNPKKKGKIHTKTEEEEEEERFVTCRAPNPHASMGTIRIQNPKLELPSKEHEKIPKSNTKRKGWLSLKSYSLLNYNSKLDTKETATEKP